MIFTSFDFVIFFGITLALYLSIRDESKRQKVLLVASSVFYGAWDARFLALLWVAIGIAFLGGLAINKNQRRKRLSVSISVTGLLGILGFFKYFDFFASSIATGMTVMGLEVGKMFLSNVSRI